MIQENTQNHGLIDFFDISSMWIDYVNISLAVL